MAKHRIRDKAIGKGQYYLRSERETQRGSETKSQRDRHREVEGQDYLRPDVQDNCNNGHTDC